MTEPFWAEPEDRGERYLGPGSERSRAILAEAIERLDDDA